MGLQEANETPILEAGTVVAGRYRTTRMIGSGGLAQVHECVHTETDRTLAIKILRTEQNGNTETVDRFLREPRAANRVKSPHIVEVLDAGTDKGRNPEIHFMVTELLEGRDLADEIAAFQGKIPRQNIFILVLQILDALIAAHTADIIHRDLKPENIFVTRDELGKMHIKLLDFGIAKMSTATNMTSTGTIMGTPWYMSLEQAMRPREVDARSDVYSMGVMLFQLLTGKLPFRGETPMAVFAQIMAYEVPAMGDVDQDLQAIVLKAMAKEQRDRYQSAADMKRAFEEYTRSQGVVSTRSTILAHVPPAPAVTAGNGAAITLDEVGQGAVAERSKTHTSSGWTTDGKIAAVRSPRSNKRAIAGVLLTAVILVGGGLGGFAAFHQSPSRTIAPAPRAAARTTPPPAPTPIALPALIESTPPVIEPPPPAPPPQAVVLPEHAPTRDRGGRHAQRGRHDPPHHAAIVHPASATLRCESGYSLHSGRCCRTLPTGAIDCDGNILP